MRADLAGFVAFSRSAPHPTSVTLADGASSSFQATTKLFTTKLEVAKSTKKGAKGCVSKPDPLHYTSLLAAPFAPLTGLGHKITYRQRPGPSRAARRDDNSVDQDHCVRA